MTNMSKMLIGTTGLVAALTIVSPAAAQQPYPYANPNGGVVGAIINSVTGGGYGQYPQGSYGYGQYPQGNYGYGQVNERAAVGMCAAAAEQRISGTYRGQPGYGYNNEMAMPTTAISRAMPMATMARAPVSSASPMSNGAITAA